MKSILTLTVFAAMALTTVNAEAKAKPETITPQAFVKELSGYFMGVSGSEPHGFHGELETLGAECVVILKRNDKGLAEMLLLKEEQTLMRLPLETGKKVLVRRSGDEDDQRDTYKFGSYGTYTVVITHVSDAYDTIQLSNGNTTLVCGAYY